MVVGKTDKTFSMGEIFSHIREIDVVTTLFPEITALPCCIKSPLREDNNPSFGFYFSREGNILYKDFSTNEKGTLMAFLCLYWHCTFKQALEKLSKIFISEKDVIIKPKTLKTFTRKEVNETSKIQVAVRPWRDYDYEYWGSYGINKKWLHKANVYPISHKIVTKADKPPYVFSADKYAYCFVEKKEGNVQIKIYQPFNTKGYKWCSKMDGSVISLWSTLPEEGEKVVICSSLKDALCLRCQCNIPTISPQGEGYSISKTAQKELKRRFKHVFICFDTDEAGRRDSTLLGASTGFINIIPELEGEKDLSDAYKHHGKEWFINNITPLFNN